MAKEQRPQKSIDDLRQEIAHSRDRLGRDLSGLRYELDFPLKLRKSFQRHAAVWLAGAALLGLMFTVRPGKRTVKIKGGAFGHAKKGEEQKKGLLQAGLAMGALRFAATMLRPMVVAFVTNKVRGYAGHSPKR